MATIRPFRGLRYSPEAGPLESLVAPPYDVLSPAERDEYARHSAYNIVHLTLPEQVEGDRSQFVKYGRSAARLEEWRRDRILQLETEPTYYRYRQSFRVPHMPDVLTRTAIIALLKLEPYESGIVLPHEQTFPKHKADRLRLLEATRAHLECIYGLYEDPEARIHAVAADAPAREVADIQTDEGVRHVLEVVTDPEAIRTLTGSIANQKLWIADGHHRYETACTFRAQLGSRPGPVAEDYIMMAMSSIRDPALVILPTHRIVPKLGMPVTELRAALAQKFTITEAPNEELVALIRERASGDRRAFGVALPGGTGWVLELPNVAALLPEIEGDASERLKSLDVSILHNWMFAKVLGVTGHDFFGYTRNEDEAIAAVESGADAAFLMNPPSVQDMQEIALQGEKMPQKSTYYYPKLLSGLVVWSLKDFEA